MKRDFVRKNGFVFIVIVIAISSISAEELGFDIFSPTPLATALRILSAQIKCVITYEDPPYLCEDDLYYLGSDSRRTMPRGGTLSYSYDTDQDPKIIIQELLNAYQAQGYTSEFSMTEFDGLYNVYPIRIKDKNCNYIPYVSPFETPVSIDAENRRSEEVLREAIESASKSYGECEIYPFELPWPGFLSPSQWSFSENIQNKPLREVLNMFVRTLNVMRREQDKLYTWSSHYTCEMERPADPKPRMVYDSWHDVLMGGILFSSSNRMQLKVEGAERPFLVALDILSKRLNMHVTYEDLPFGSIPFCCPDTVEVIDGIVELDWDQNWAIEKTLHELGREENRVRDMRDMFEIEKTVNGYHMFPVKVLNNWQSLKNFHKITDIPMLEYISFIPVLSQEVTVSDDSPDDLDLLTKVCGATATACGKAISIKTMDSQISSKLADKSKAMSRPKGPMKAQAYLDAIVTAHCPEATWRLLYEPAEDKYVLDVYDPQVHPNRSAQYMHENNP